MKKKQLAKSRQNFQRLALFAHSTEDLGSVGRVELFSAFN